MTKHFEFKEPTNKEVIWKEYPESKGMVCPWFLSDLLGLLDNSVVSQTSAKYVSIISEDRPFNDITIFFEDKVFALMVDFKKLIYTRQQYFAFEGFCEEYGLRLTEYVNEEEGKND